MINRKLYTGVLLVLIISKYDWVKAGILYHRDSETRQSISLDGLWKFTIPPTTNEEELTEQCTIESKLKANLLISQMPVPSSYNDLPTDSAIRDHVGPVFYERKFFVPKSWSSEIVWIRFGSVCYSAEVSINGKWAVSHAIGHLPFQAQVTSLLKFGQENIITVIVDNTLAHDTIPQGGLSFLNSGRIKQTYTFDFFNYAGIDRPVLLYTTPASYIDDVTVRTSINGNAGKVDYEINVISDQSSSLTTKVALEDENGNEVTSLEGSSTGTLEVPEANFWWPYLVHSNPGYLYTLKIELLDSDGNLVDIYRQRVGIRTVSWTNTSLLINNRSVYLRGFGRHEDSDLRGKGLDLPLIIRDYNLIKWIGANSYRTSHYPYAEEIMDLADELGIMIIDETPAVNTENFTPELLENHKKAITELVNRDKNRPGVIIWSVANEPRTGSEVAGVYYKTVIEHLKSMDKSRPVTMASSVGIDLDYSAPYVDIISYNSYRAWYENPGDLDTIYSDAVQMAREWNIVYNVPVLITEYGADTQEGLHILPEFIWSEEYQNRLLSKHFESFDQLRRDGFFIGEMIWNFADFKTAQTYTRVGGNKKGIFTRNRQPKSSAHLVRKRYWQLANDLDGADLPNDLYDYVYEP